MLRNAALVKIWQMQMKAVEIETFGRDGSENGKRKERRRRSQEERVPVQRNSSLEAVAWLDSSAFNFAPNFITITRMGPLQITLLPGIGPGSFLGLI